VGLEADSILSEGGKSKNLKTGVKKKAKWKIKKDRKRDNLGTVFKMKKGYEEKIGERALKGERCESILTQTVGNWIGEEKQTIKKTEVVDDDWKGERWDRREHGQSRDREKFLRARKSGPENSWEVRAQRGR